MADIALDTDGDLLLGDDSLVLAEGDDAIVQQLTIRFKFILGEWFLDRRQGLPLFDEVLVKNPELSRVRSIFRQTILTTPGIATIEEFTLTLESATRKASMVFLAKKTDGELLEYDEDFIIA